MGFSSWLFTDSKKNLRVKIVHPSGHAELHERPVLASEILRRNPKCCVAHPNVFKQPWDIVQPDTMLMPGQKFYIVPISTIRKLQMISLKNPSSRLEDVDQSQGQEGGEEDGFFSPCWSTTPKSQPACLKSSGEQGIINGSSSCFTCLVKRRTNKDGNKDSSRETKSSGSSGSCEAKKSLCRKAKEESPRRSLAYLEYWQPDLQSVDEE